MSENKLPETKPIEVVTNQPIPPKRNTKNFFLKSDPKTRFRFLPALLLSYATPILLAIAFSVLGAATNPSLAQIYLLIMAISFCLMGMLTRSKAMGLLNIFIAPASFLTIYVLSLATNGFIYNAFGIFSAMTYENQLTSLANNLSNLGYQELAQAILQNNSTINIVLLVIDLVFVELIAFFLGFFLAMLSTGITSKDGSISIVALISKPLAAIFAITILLLVPFTYHGTSNLVVGTTNLANGAIELAGIFSPQSSPNTGGAVAAQADLTQLNFTDPAVQEWLKQKTVTAKEWFIKASQRFDHVQGNFLLNLFLQTMVPPEMALPSGDVIRARNIPQLLDLTDVMVEVLDAFPHLVTGYADLITGASLVQKTLNETGFSSIGTTTSVAMITSSSLQQLIQYDTSFKSGLQKIENGINEFKLAQAPLIRAIDKAKPLISEVFVSADGATQQFLTQILDELKFGLPIALNASDALIPAANGTYKALLAQKALGLNSFKEALSWISLAAQDINASDTLLQAIDTSPLDQINNSLVPFKDAFNLMRDLISTYANFIQAMRGSVGAFLSINATLSALDNLNFSDISPSASQWNVLRQNITELRQFISEVDTAFQTGSTETTTFLNRAQNNEYGVFSQNAEQIFSTVNEFYTTFGSNITDYRVLAFVLELTFNATYEFSAGQYNLELSIGEAINSSLTGTEFGNLATTQLAQANFSQSKTHSQAAYNLLLTNISGINRDAREKWKDALYEGINNNQSKSIYGASQAGLDAISIMTSQGNFNLNYAQQVLAFFEAIDFSSIFQQQGGGSSRLKETSSLHDVSTNSPNRSS